MRKFKMTIAVCLLMAIGVPFADCLAVTASSPTYTHFLYVAGHAGWLHWIVNAWALLALHNLFRWYRVLFSYFLAVTVGYIMLPALPMVGASVITCFFIGFATPHFWRKSRLTVMMTLAILALGCILPGFAGLQHIVIFIAGLLFFYCEGYFRRLNQYLKR